MTVLVSHNGGDFMLLSHRRRSTIVEELLLLVGHLGKLKSVKFPKKLNQIPPTHQSVILHCPGGKVRHGHLVDFRQGKVRLQVGLQHLEDLEAGLENEVALAVPDGIVACKNSLAGIPHVRYGYEIADNNTEQIGLHDGRIFENGPLVAGDGPVRKIKRIEVCIIRRISAINFLLFE